MDQQFGVVSYPQTTEYLGGRTMIQPGERPNGVTRAWAVSSVVLGSLYLLALGVFFLNGYLSSHHHPHQHIPMSVALVVMTATTLLSIVLALGFMAAGGGVIGRLELGRKALTLVSGAGIVVSLVGLASIWVFFTDPQVIAVLMANAPQNPTMATPIDTYHLMRMSGMLVAGMASVITTIQVIYCGFLCQHMTSRSARAAMKFI